MSAIKMRHDVLQAIRGTEGLTRAEVVEALGRTDDPSSHLAINNALYALRNEGSVSFDGTRYTAIPQSESNHEGDHV